MRSPESPVPSSIRVCHGERSFPLSLVRERLGLSLPSDIPPSARVGILVPDGPLLPAVLCWAREANRSVVLLFGPTDRARDEELARAAGCTHLLTAGMEAEDCAPVRLDRLGPPPAAGAPSDAAPAAASEAEIVLLTSGTSGPPKCVRHTWASLRESVVIRPALGSARWMSLYPLTRFAGLNTLLHALLNGATLIIPENLTAASILDSMERWRPTHVSGTPTMWKRLLMSVPEAASWLPEIRQVTLGGEIADPGILKALRSAVPAARITHVYATTEAGVCLSVSDGAAGFPASWLDRERGSVRLTIRDGELWIRRSGPRSSAVAGSAGGGWWNSGDLVRVDGDRVRFLGRRTDQLNVGGAKVAPGEVEACISEVPGVVAVRVSGKKSSLAGTLVHADLVPEAGVDRALLRQSVIRHCRDRLAAWAVPRSVDFLDALPVSISGKLERDEPGPVVETAG